MDDGIVIADVAVEHTCDSFSLGPLRIKVFVCICTSGMSCQRQPLTIADTVSIGPLLRNRPLSLNRPACAIALPFLVPIAVDEEVGIQRGWTYAKLAPLASLVLSYSGRPIPLF